MPALPVKRQSKDGTAVVSKIVVDYVENLSFIKRTALFFTGLIVFLVPVANIVINHMIRNTHNESVPILIAESALSLGFFVFGLAAMIPPFGIWVLSKVFRLKYFNKQ